MGKEKKPALGERAAKLAREMTGPSASEPHEYQNPVHGKCGVCGYGPDVSRHLSSASRAADEAPGPLAEIRERTFTYEGAVLNSNVHVATALENATHALYQRVSTAGFTPVDTTLKVDVGPGTGPSARLTVALSVRAWKAVAL